MNKIIENDFSRIDLNLLTVLMVLYREGSVTRTTRGAASWPAGYQRGAETAARCLTTRCSCAAPEGMLPTPQAQALMTDLQPLMENLHFGDVWRRRVRPGARAAAFSHRPQRLERTLADAPRCYPG